MVGTRRLDPGGHLLLHHYLLRSNHCLGSPLHHQIYHPSLGRPAGTIFPERIPPPGRHPCAVYRIRVAHLYRPCRRVDRLHHRACHGCGFGHREGIEDLYAHPDRALRHCGDSRPVPGGLRRRLERLLHAQLVGTFQPIGVGRRLRADFLLTVGEFRHHDDLRFLSQATHQPDRYRHGDRVR